MLPLVASAMRWPGSEPAVAVRVLDDVQRHPILDTAREIERLLLRIDDARLASIEQVDGQQGSVPDEAMEAKESLSQRFGQGGCERHDQDRASLGPHTPTRPGRGSAARTADSPAGRNIPQGGDGHSRVSPESRVQGSGSVLSPESSPGPEYRPGVRNSGLETPGRGLHSGLEDGPWTLDPGPGRRVRTTPPLWRLAV